MKALQPLFLFLLLYSGVLLRAQESNEMQYLFGSGQSLSISGFGGPMAEFSSIRGEFAVSAGGGGGILINQRFILGGYGLGLTTRHYYDEPLPQSCLKDPLVGFGHGGFLFGYIPDPNSKIHLSFTGMIGWGAISLYDDYDQDIEDHLGVDNVFVFLPKAEAELNITRWFRLAFGLGYRFVGGIDKRFLHTGGNYYQYYREADFNGPLANISLLFGSFKTKNQ
ncbi:MAG TPA: hypothetical protein P5531_11015 [Bacteroidales bacterium]|nr:hypothetical protein [Bacteroidales bacterium]HSA44093.1 hypothetical protein [Bacteroidales bacterium]